MTHQLPLITVVGAHSKQGRSVATSLLQSGRYHVRALTRRTDTAAAQHLAQQGAEVVAVPLQLGNKQAFVQAFRGAQGAFIMTPGIAPPDTSEVALGKEQADAAVEAGVEHVVFSGLENVDKLTSGKKWAPHFTDKALIEEYIRGLPLRSSFVYLSFFYTNLMEYYPPSIDRGVVTFSVYLPGDMRAPFVDPLTDTGPAVLEVFDHPEKYRGSVLPVVGEILSPHEMVAGFTRVTGKPAVYQPAYTRQTLLARFPGFGANELLVQELLGMAEYAIEYGYYRQDRDLEWSRRINLHTTTWEKFLKNTRWNGETMSFRS